MADSNAGSDSTPGVDHVVVNAAEEWTAFDCLHPNFKKLIQYAPICQTAIEMFQIQLIYGPDIGPILVEEQYDKLFPGWKMRRDLK